MIIENMNVAISKIHCCFEFKPALYRKSGDLVTRKRKDSDIRIESQKNRVNGK